MAAPLKIVFPKKASLFSRVTEQLRFGFQLERSKVYTFDDKERAWIGGEKLLLESQGRN